MNDSVRSFEEYRRFIRRLLKPLSVADGLRFCSWCVKRFEADFGEAVWDGLRPSERIELEAILISVHSAAASESPVTSSQAVDFQKQLESFGPGGEVEAIEVDPDATEFRALVWNVLDFCKTADHEALALVSESLVNSVDHHLMDQGPNYGTDNMFGEPGMKHELEIQAEFVGQLGSAADQP